MTDYNTDRDPEFEAWAASLPLKHWARRDITAARQGWNAAKELYAPADEDQTPFDKAHAEIKAVCEERAAEQLLPCIDCGKMIPPPFVLRDGAALRVICGDCVRKMTEPAVQELGTGVDRITQRTSFTAQLKDHTMCAFCGQSIDEHQRPGYPCPPPAVESQLP